MQQLGYRFKTNRGMGETTMKISSRMAVGGAASRGSRSRAGASQPRHRSRLRKLHEQHGRSAGLEPERPCAKAALAMCTRELMRLGSYLVR